MEAGAGNENATENVLALHFLLYFRLHNQTSFFEWIEAEGSFKSHESADKKSIETI